MFVPVCVPEAAHVLNVVVDFRIEAHSAVGLKPTGMLKEDIVVI